MGADLVLILQEASLFVLTVLCIFFGYAAFRWVLNTYFPERFITINRYHNDELISSHKIDLKTAEPLVRQLRTMQKEGRNG